MNPVYSLSILDSPSHSMLEDESTQCQLGGKLACLKSHDVRRVRFSWQDEVLVD